jgi:hypothetical protein
MSIAKEPAQRNPAGELGRAIVRTLCEKVQQRREMRGRHRRATSLASFMGVNQQVHDMNTKKAGPEVALPYESRHSVDNNWCSPELEVVGADRFTAYVATTIQAVEKLRPIWGGWTQSLDTDIDYYLHNLKTDSTVLRPHVITVYKDGVAQAMLVGQVRNRRMPANISFVRIRGPKVRVLEIENGGRLGRRLSAIDKLLASVLLKDIKSGDVDLLCFQRLSLHSDLFLEVRQLLKARVPQIFCYSVLSLAAPTANHPSIFFGKTRREVTRKTRNLQSAFPGKVRFKCFSQPSELDIGIRDAMVVSIATWQYCFGWNLLNTPQAHEGFKFCARQGWLRVFVLYVEDLPCAFLIGQLYNNTFYCQHVGYDRNFARFSVGSLLTAWAFENMASAGVQRVDLGKGGQENGRRMGCQMFEEGTVHAYSRTLRGISLNVLFALTGVVRAVGRHILTTSQRNWIVRIRRQFFDFTV